MAKDIAFKLTRMWKDCGQLQSGENPDLECLENRAGILLYSNDLGGIYGAVTQPWVILRHPARNYDHVRGKLRVDVLWKTRVLYATLEEL